MSTNFGSLGCNPANTFTNNSSVMQQALQNQQNHYGISTFQLDQLSQVAFQNYYGSPSSNPNIFTTGITGITGTLAVAGSSIIGMPQKAPSRKPNQDWLSAKVNDRRFKLFS